MTRPSRDGVGIGDHIFLDDALWRVDGVEGTAVQLVNLGTGSALSRSINELLWDPSFSPFMNGATDSGPDVLSAAGALRVSPAVMARAVALGRHIEEFERGMPFLPDEVPPEGFKPRACYRPDRPLGEKYASKVSELAGTDLQCSLRQLERHVANYRRHGVLGLVPKREFVKQVRRRRMDPRFLEVLASQLLHEIDGPERGPDAILAVVRLVIEGNSEYAGVEMPSVSTQKRVLRELQEHVGWRKGRRKYVQSTKKRPDRTFLAIAPLVPGERVEVDTTVLNVLARDPFSGGSYRPSLSVAIDVATRCIVGLVVSGFDDHSIMPRLMLDAMSPKPAVPVRQAESYVNRLGLPPEVLLEIHPDLPFDGMLPEGPLVRPRTVVIDQGKPYYNRQVLLMLGRIGAAVELARPATPTDKPHVERFFRTLETLLMGLKGYVGKDVASGGTRAPVNRDDLLTEAELETVIRAWVAMVYHHRRHASLTVPVSRGRTVRASPMEMYALLVEQHGFIPAPLNPELRYLVMSVERLTIQNDGLHLDGLKYDSSELDHVRKVACPWSRDGLWQVHYDPMDCRRVHVLLPVDGRRVWVEVPWKHRPPEMKHPFPFRVLNFARSYRPTLGTGGSTVSWEKPARSRTRGRSSTSAADDATTFLHWAAQELASERELGEDRASVEMRAIRAWASALHGTPLEHLEARYLSVEIVEPVARIHVVDGPVDPRVTAGEPDATGLTGDLGGGGMRAAWRTLASDDLFADEVDT